MEIEILVPDIGDFESVDVIDVLVKPGDQVEVEDPLITLESEKATMDIPSPRAGRVGQLSVKVGDKVNEGRRILLLEVLDETTAVKPAAPVTAAPVPPAPAPSAAPAAPAPATPPPPAPAAARQPAGPRVIVVPELGDFPSVDVIEVLVKAGDSLEADAPLVTLESEKATMEIPSPCAGEVLKVLVKVGDKVSAGTPLAEMMTTTPAEAAVTSPAPAPAAATPTVTAAPAAPAPAPVPTSTTADAPPHSRIYAGPALRKLARELGVDLARVSGSGRKGRLVRADLFDHVKKTLTTEPRATAGGGGGGLPVQPSMDFSRFGTIEVTPLSKIRRATGQNLHRSWLLAPHVTQFDEADITDLEAFRKAQTAETANAGTKLTLMAFLIKAVTAALARFPDFNSSLSPDGESLIHKRYFNIGMAANTPRGLVVPVIRDAERKGLLALAAEVRDLALRARDGKLAPAEMQGACFTISSLGGVSGTAFTPIINVPEVAILGISPARMKPVWIDGAFQPRLMLPLSLSYDHRVIDGVAAAEFTGFLATLLADLRRVLL